MAELGIRWFSSSSAARRMIRVGVVVAMGVVFFLGSRAWAQSWDLALDYSLRPGFPRLPENPSLNDAWEYFFATRVDPFTGEGGVFDPITRDNANARFWDLVPEGVLVQFAQQKTPGFTAIMYNMSDVEFTDNHGTTWKPFEPLAHPGNPTATTADSCAEDDLSCGPQHIAYFWNAPDDGTYEIDAHFEKRQTSLTVDGEDTEDIDVHVRHNGMSLFTSTLGCRGWCDEQGAPTPEVLNDPNQEVRKSYVATLDLMAGDTIEFLVGGGYDVDPNSLDGAFQANGDSAAVNAVITAVTVSELAEDFDGNGTVDFGDFVQFSNAFGQDVPPADAQFDLDGNGTIGFGDFVQFSNAFGNMAGIAAVPEPASNLLLLMGLAVALRPLLAGARRAS